MTISHERKKQLYEWCLQDGLSLEYGKLSLCDLKNFYYSNVYDDRRYQVHCEDPKYGHSMIYDDVHSAIEKFIELQKRVKRIK